MLYITYTLLGDIMYTNLVFGGGGVHGIAYLGVLKYLDEVQLLREIDRVAGTSAGAISALLTSFNLPFWMMKNIVDTIDYEKMIEDREEEELLQLRDMTEQLEMIFGNIHSSYRFMKHYGWHSTEYIYKWLQDVINEQFDQNLKKPPYTFRDFKNRSIHKTRQPFKDLYILGTNLNQKKSVVFSYETTPDIEVALAVRISMSIPFFFEAVKIENQVFVDGGVMQNYPIRIFDVNGYNKDTLGMKIDPTNKENEIDNIIDFTKNISLSFLKKEEDIFEKNIDDIKRTIEIDASPISSLNFHIKKEDPSYILLYNRGYQAALQFFRLKP